MTITEKQLAKELAERHDFADMTEEEPFAAVARRAAELLGVQLVPEKPEPGTWHIVADGPQTGDAARVDEDGYLHIIGPIGKTLRDIHPDNTWPALTPARIVPAEPIEDARASAVDIIEEVLKNHIRVRLNIADTGGENAHSGTINQIRHLHLAEPHLPAVEAANRLCDVGVLSALAKHGGARKLPGRMQVEQSLIEGLAGTGEDFSYEARQLATNAVMKLLGGGGA